jgi:beta-glucosidase
VRVSELMAKMTLDDKISMVHGVSGAYVGVVAANPALCIPALNLEDGPAGVGDGLTGVTQLPAPVAAAATWDPSAAAAYGHVIGAEDQGKGVNVDLGPTINIVRDPRWGRAFESMGEDPYLAGQLGASEIQGIQSTGTMAQVKHLAVYNQETNRNTPQDDAIVSTRAEQEIYLPAFQAAVTKGGASSVMCSYSSINGPYACQDPYLEAQVLRDQFGFQGFVTSDWGATHSTVPSALAGLDMEMPGDSDYGPALKTAVQAGQVPMSTLNSMVSNILTEMFKFGLFDHAPAGSPDATVTTPQHQSVAQAVAEQGTVLLQNTGNILPLGTSSVKSIAVIGTDAGSQAQTDGGGSAGVTSSGTVTPLQAITTRAGSGIQVNYAQGPSSGGALPAIPASAFTAPLSASFYNDMTLDGTPVATRADPNVDFNFNSVSPQAGVNATQWSARWTGTLNPPATGSYTFSLTSDDGSRLFINGQQVIDNWRDQASNTQTAMVSLTAGQPASIEVDYYQDGGASLVSLGWQPPGPDPITQAADTAKSSDVAVVFASDFETEGSDLTSIDLPTQENQLISAVAAANPNTIVVLNTGSAVTMPWLSQVKGVLEAWYPGQEDGSAIAAVLFGDVNPSGHLPVTFPKSLADVPASTPAQWPGVNGQVQYSEGVDVGYRWYAAKDIAPLFPFGYGLSYTQFTYSGIRVTPGPITARGQVTVSADVTNTGKRAGADVAQLYVSDPAATGEPPQQLKGFDKVSLKPGQTKRVSFRLPAAQAFSYWDSDVNAFAVADGAYKLSIGDSSASLPLAATVRVTRTYGPQGLSLSAPSSVTTGATATVTATFSNADSDVPALGVTVSLKAPSGWAVTPAADRLPAVGARTTATATFQLTASSSASGGAAQLNATARYVVPGVGAQHLSGSASVAVPYSSLSSAFNTVGVSDNSNPAAGNFDGSGYSYSAQSLASVEITPGSTVSSGGFSFSWPDVPAGQPDVVTTNGQVIDLSGSGYELAFLGAANSATVSGQVTVGYTDGTTATGTITFSDWYADAAVSGDSLVATVGWNEPAGSTLDPNHQVSLYSSTIQLNPNKTVAWVQLTSNPAIHVFATAFGPVPYSSLSAAVNDVGITDDSNPTVGNYGGPGYSFSAEALAAAGITPGSTVSSGGLSFTWPDVAVGQPDNVVPNGQVITLSGTGGHLGFLGAANNGTATGQPRRETRCRSAPARYSAGQPGRRRRRKGRSSSATWTAPRPCSTARDPRWRCSARTAPRRTRRRRAAPGAPSPAGPPGIATPPSARAAGCHRMRAAGQRDWPAASGQPTRACSTGVDPVGVEREPPATPGMAAGDGQGETLP